MKLTKKLFLFEEFAANASDTNNTQASAPTTANSVSLDKTKNSEGSPEAIRTEVLKDVDSILTRLSELSDNIKEGLDIHVGFNKYESLLEDLMQYSSKAYGIESITEASLSGIEFGNDDDIHPTKFKPLAISLKKNKVKMEVEKEEGDHGYPEVKLTGKRKDIEKVLADVWGPDSVSDHEDYFESAIIEEGFLDALGSVGAFASNPIKFTKIKNNIKKYKKALIQISINDVDFAKKKQASDDDGKDKQRADTLAASNKAKNKALKDQADAISDRMTQLASTEPLKKYVSISKNGAKMEAAQIVLKATSGEEAKQLKLKIETLADRIADDGKSLKDYAKEDGKETAQDTSIDGGSKGEGSKGEGSKGEGSKGEGAKGEGKPKVDTEKLDAAVTTAEEAKTNLPEDANKQDKAKADVVIITAKIAAADAKGEDTKDLKTQLAAAELTAAMVPLPAPSNNTGGGDELTQDQKDRIKTEEDQKKEREQELATEMAKPEEERNQQKIDGLNNGIAKNVQDIKDIKAEVDDSQSINTEGTLVEASLNGLMALDTDEDDYAYLIQQAKKLGVKVSVDKDPYGDGYDELNYSGDKAALLKLAKISGHDADLTGGPDEGGYWITETEAVELPKTIKLDENLSVAEKFAILMNK